MKDQMIPSNYKRISSFSLIIISLFTLLFCISIPSEAQKKERTRLKAYYSKLPNKDKKVTLTLTQGRGKKMQGIGDAEIVLTTSLGDSTIEMATVQTDSLGASMLLIESGYKFPVNEDGYAMIKASYAGNDSLRSSKKEIEFLDLNMELSLEVEDSVKVLTLATYQFDQDGNKKAVEDLGVRVGVKRLLSNLYLNKISTDEDGIASYEFPNDIPGDSIGTITIVAIIEDHEDFGTVTQTQSIQWGTVVEYTSKSSERSLFGDSAPLWMIISVAIILGGAWIHFLWAIFKVFRIKNLA